MFRFPRNSGSRRRGMFFQAPGRADFVGFDDKSGFALYWEIEIFDNMAPKLDFGVDESQQTLNCALSVDLL